MKPIHTVALIGGTGKAGKYLLKQLLLQNFRVKLLHRKPETLRLNNPLIEVIKGDARDHHAIDMLLKGCDAVLSCLSQPVGEPTIFSDAARNILQAMGKHKISRYITTAGLNVDTPTDKKSATTQFGTKWMYENFPLTTKDRQVEYELLAESDTDWTMVRLPLIEQTDRISEVNVSLTDCSGNNISATNLALFMIAQLTSEDFARQAPFIADK
ncbi:NAD-dependent epimerase/dehydratase family protein [Mucilaginibacter conchicola]|uniref:NAD-dependent epimerase/dehydratase family protein n=1 Tax=Mucilaginibacter conchicola TaxID=2303333 RepID=A0A372NQG9_9SPHI|nr:NAD(P)H-binding protein [Mucilaginibacter conchicola]RFZ90900.1 NAD-dependent epimerase/dehydratase family protein [Mucilaginibacter conchicola]